MQPPHSHLSESRIGSPSRLRVLHLSGRGDLSGGPIVMANLIESLPDLEHFAVYPFQSLHTRLLQQANCHSVDWNLHNLRPQNLLRLRQLVRAEEPDLIHCHGKAAGLWGRLLGGSTGVPVVHQFHGMHWRHYPFVGQGLYFAYERWFAHWTKGFVFVSHGEMDEYEQWIGGQTPCAVIPNGLGSTTPLTPERRQRLQRELGLLEGIPVLASITRAVYQKSLGRLLKIHAELLRYRPAQLLLFGVKPEELERFQPLAQQRAYLRCLFDEQNVPEKLQLADLYLSTSRWEGFSLGLLEALGNGVPAVVSAVTGHLDLLPLHPRGLRLVGTNSVQEYLQILLQWLEQPEERQQAGALARSYVQTHFGQQQAAQQMLRFYRQVLHPQAQRQDLVQNPLWDLPN